VVYELFVSVLTISNPTTANTTTTTTKLYNPLDLAPHPQPCLNFIDRWSIRTVHLCYRFSDTNELMNIFIHHERWQNNKIKK